ncbi:MAG: DNA polymerase III subunit alpha, partial [Betaproteobacteria bacterium]|nr:DNA polymerase III subunit alpha [Betaproteobacteria bacterium]
GSAIYKNFYIRSLATRDSTNELSPAIKKVVEFLKSQDFDLILVETSGIGQASDEITKVASKTLYVMTPEYGAATQLEKIEMLEVADFIAVNKYEKPRSEDALRDVRKQYRRNKNLFANHPGSPPDHELPIFGTMASKAVIRDVGRVLDIGYNFCDQLSKLIPVVQNKPLSLAKAKEAEPVLKQREADEDEVREILALAEPLEDIIRNVGMHAGGVLIAPGQLTDFCPLYRQPGDESAVISQFDKDDVEAVGLVKFDFLGLRNLSIIEMTVESIRKRAPGFVLDEATKGFSDPAAYQVLKQANTTAIFQLESDGMKKLLKKLEPDRFEDIIAVLALYRPGPLGSGMVDDFVLRKKGVQRIDYFHPDLQACLEPTYGVIVYQEQVMQIAQIIGGYTLGSADLLRRAMGKKKAEEMAQQRDVFVKGATAKGYALELATKLFDLMAMFAEYGFNKSHTAAYAVITYQTAWLKAHYPAEFMAATLSSDMDDTDKVQLFVADARFNGVEVLPPDLHASAWRFEPVYHASKAVIRYGLGAVKGAGEAAIKHLIAAREKGAFKHLFDL